MKYRDFWEILTRIHVYNLHRLFQWISSDKEQSSTVHYKLSIYCQLSIINFINTKRRVLLICKSFISKISISFLLEWLFIQLFLYWYNYFFFKTIIFLFDTIIFFFLYNFFFLFFYIISVYFYILPPDYFLFLIWILMFLIFWGQIRLTGGPGTFFP